MPSVSQAQHNLMEAVAHDKGFAEKAGISQKVGRDFANKDQKSGKFGRNVVRTLSKMGKRTLEQPATESGAPAGTTPLPSKNASGYSPPLGRDTSNVGGEPATLPGLGSGGRTMGIMPTPVPGKGGNPNGAKV